MRSAGRPSAARDGPWAPRWPPSAAASCARIPTSRADRHGFIASQKEGLDVFSRIDPDAPLIVAEAVWQYSHHVLGGLISHRGPILTVANWCGAWPGLVGMLNLNGSLTKAGVPYSTLWSEDFADDSSSMDLRTWLRDGAVSASTHRT